jgi:3-oxoacyl-[acyl-carrier protein] reductase
MDLQLTGKTALITGPSAGIGFPSAVALAREGASVVLNGRDEGRLADAEQRLLSLVPGASVRTSAADVLTAEGVDDLVKAVPEVDILINSAATFGPTPFAEISDTEWTRFFDTNVMSGVRLSRHYITGMLARNSGRIVFISSEAAVQVTAGQLHDAVTKGAVLALSRGLADLTRGTEVTVNTVLPGPTATEGIDTVNEVANLIAYLASPLASVTNGAVLRAEGGAVQTILRSAT